MLKQIWTNEEQGMFHTAESITGGGMISLAANGMNVNALRPYKKHWRDSHGYININGVERPVANALLQYDEWRYLDENLMEIFRNRLAAVDDLISRNLTMDIGNGLAKTVLTWQREGDTQDAQFTMDGVTPGRDDQPAIDTKHIPLPICSKDFTISLRHLEESRNMGIGLDLTNARQAARKVAEALEKLLIVGTGGLTYGGGTIYGYMNHTDINTVTLSQNWTASGKTGAEIVTDVLNCITALQADNRFGPYVLYIPQAYDVALEDDFKANSDLTIRQRLMMINGISDIRTLDYLTANNVLLVQLDDQTVDMVTGMAPTLLQWDAEGGLQLRFKYMTIMVPRVKSDKDGKSGIVKLAA